MKERPINCTADEVRGLLNGTLTELRRPVTRGPRQTWLTPEVFTAVKRFAPSIDGWWTMAVGEERRIIHCGHEMDGGHIGSVRCPFGVPGDTLWVRETWAPFEFAYESLKPSYLPNSARIVYLADQERRLSGDTYLASTQMPRWASRLTLTITNVRVERDGERWMWVVQVAKGGGR